MALVGSNIRSGSWKLTYDIINGIANVGSVYSKFPESQQVNFPMTIIDNVDATYSVATKGNFNADITIPVTLYQKSGKNLDIQTDRVVGGLEGSRTAFLGSAIKLLSIDDGGQGTNTYGNTNIHFKVLNVNFMGFI